MPGAKADFAPIRPERCTSRAPHPTPNPHSVEYMSTNNRDEVREFLTSRRATVRPEQVEPPDSPTADALRLLAS